MKIKRTIIWSVVNEKPHPKLTEKERMIEGYMPLISALFPGITYFSISGFGSVINNCAVPVLKKLFPELLTTKAENISARELVEVEPFLPSRGYEWQTSTRWQSKLRKLLAA